MRRIYWLYLVMFLVLTACGGGGSGGSGGSASLFPSGTDPDSFSFGAATNVALDSDIQSSDITPTGYIYTADIKIINGVYSTDGGATWSDTGTSYTGRISPGTRIRVKQHSAATISTTTVTYLSIGNTVGTFTTITKSNAAPTANVNVKPKQNGVNPGTLVTLDGSVSTGAQPLSYLWTFTPAQGSSLSPSLPSVASPTFTPDIPGNYAATLVVTDKNGLSSTARQVVVTSSALASSGNISVYRADVASNPSSSTNTFGNTNFYLTFVINNTGSSPVNSITIVSLKNAGLNGPAPKFCTTPDCKTTSDTVDITIQTIATGKNPYTTASSLTMSSTDFSNIDTNGWTASSLTTQ